MAKQYVKLQETLGNGFSRKEINVCACPECGELLLPTPGGYVTCLQPHLKLLPVPPEYAHIAKLVAILDLPLATKGKGSPAKYSVAGMDGRTFNGYRQKTHSDRPRGLVVAKQQGHAGWFRRRLVPA